ncbi:hypothetical protein FB107DRAFT_280273 [Schizophyllum commune]
MQNEAGDDYHRHFPSSPTSLFAVFFCDPEPPEARVRTPRAKGAKVKAPFTLFPLAQEVLGQFRFFADFEPPEARAGSLGEISEDGGTSTPLLAFTRGQREVLRTHSSRKGLYFVCAEPGPPEACEGSLGEGRGRGRILLTLEPPEASAGSLDEECGKGGIPDPRAGQAGGAASPLTPVLVIFADPKPPEASARTLGEGCGRGGVPLPTRARPESGVARLNRVFCWSQTAEGMRAHPRRGMRQG